MRCKSKRKYKTRDEAMIARRKMHTARDYEKDFLSPYKCKHCKGWHLGKKEQSVIMLIDYALSH